MDNCPSNEDLRRFLENCEPAAIGPHLRVCESCQAAAERLSDDGSLRPSPYSLTEPAWDWGSEAELSSVLKALQGEVPVLRHRSQGGSQAHPPIVLDPSDTVGMLGRLGPYDVEEEVGRGGMGVVYRARDRTTGRFVALKVLHTGADDERMRRRFSQEVRAVAKVEHDHVVRLYSTSDPADRVPYFAMEYLAGPSLADRIQLQVRIAPREAAEIVAQAASGLQAAHLAGLVHSDIKPANILFDPTTGRAKVGDFGLARLSSEVSNLSREGMLPGTPAYLSPEQARGVAEPDPRTDVYSLGVTFYECLAGEPPFRGEVHRIIQQVLHDEPRPPRVFHDAIPRDLETICLKAMAKEPARRYQTAAAFADDLRLFLRGEPIKARPAGATERGWRWCRNNRRIASLGAIASLLLITLAVGASVAAIWISRERSIAVSQAKYAEVQRGLTLRAFTSLIEGIQDQLATRPGTLELRRSLLENARLGLSRVARESSQPGNSEVNVITLEAIKKLGDIDLILGRTTEARAEFDEATRMAERVASIDPKSIGIRRELASSYDRLGDAAARSYLGKDKDGNYEKSYAIRRALFAENSQDPTTRRDLRVSLGKMGDLRNDGGDLASARRFYNEALKSLEAEPVTEASRATRLLDLRFIHGRIGRLDQKEFKGTEAIARFRESLADAEALCKLDPENATYRRQRAFAQDYLGVACLGFGEMETAEQALIAFRDDRKAALAADPSDQEVRRSVALAHQHLGDVETQRRNFDSAKVEYLEAMAIFDEVARKDAGSVMSHKDRLLILRRLMQMELAADNTEAAAKWLDCELKIQADKSVPPHPDQKGWVDEAIFIRDLCRLATRCLDDPSLARAQPPQFRGSLLQLRAIGLARAGRDTEAALAARELLSLQNDKETTIVAARVYALTAKYLARDRADKRSAYVKAAIDALKIAIKADPALARTVKYDIHLEGLQDDPDYKALFAHG